MHDLGGCDSDWWGLDWKPRLPEAEWATPPTLPGLLRTTDEQEIFWLWLLLFLFFFICFHFLHLRKKKSLAHSGGIFLHYNINTICMRSWQAPSFFSSNSSAPSCNQSAELSQKQAQLGQSGQHNKYTTLNGQLSLSLQPRDSGYFISWSFISTLNTEDDSVHNCFLVTHRLSIRHSHLKGRLCSSQPPSPVTL